MVIAVDRKLPLIQTSAEDLSPELSLVRCLCLRLLITPATDFGVPGDSGADRSMAAECEKERGVSFQSPDPTRPHTFVMLAFKLKPD